MVYQPCYTGLCRDLLCRDLDRAFFRHSDETLPVATSQWTEWIDVDDMRSRGRTPLASGTSCRASSSPYDCRRRSHFRGSSPGLVIGPSTFMNCFGRISIRGGRETSTALLSSTVFVSRHSECESRSLSCTASDQTTMTRSR